MAGATILTSTSGGARIDVIPNPSYALADAYEARGYTLDKRTKSRVLYTAGPASTCADWLRIGALRVERKDAAGDHVTCVLSPRSYMGSVAYTAIHKACRDAGFARVNGIGWTRRMPDAEMRDLEKLVGKRSKERAEQKAASRRLGEGISAFGESLETRRDALSAKWEARARADPSFARRDGQYTQLLLSMAARNAVSWGSDGAPNWPSPPVPGQKGIVAAGSEHLACYPPRYPPRRA